MKHFDSLLCISIWKFIILKPYLSSLLFLVPDEKTGGSVWSSYVRTLNTCLKSKVRISFYVISSFCMMLNMWFWFTNAWVFLCSLLFVCYHMVSDVITFYAAGWKKTKEHKDQEKNVLDLILKLINMAWITNALKVRNLHFN